MHRPNTNEDLATIVRSSQSRPFRKWSLILAGIALLGGGAWFYLTHKKEDDGKTEYVTEPASLGRISLIVTAAGNLAPINQVVIGSELSGTIVEVNVDTNDSVKKNQQIAKLDTSKLNQQTERSRAALLSAKARVSQAKATLEEAKAAFARQQELHELSSGKTPSRATMETSRATVSRAEADLESAQASVAGAEAEVRAFERDLEKAIIRSPVDGVVLSRTVEVGQTVAASFTAPTLFTIAEDLKKMELLVSVTEADIGRVQTGQTATFSVDAWPRRKYTATVKKVAFGSANNQNTGSGSNNNNNNNGAASTGVVTYSTELEVANDDLSLRPGMTATVDIAIMDKQDIIVVPNTALRFDPEAAAAIGKPAETKRTLVQSLAPGSSRRWRSGTPIPKKEESTSDGPRVFILKNDEPVEVRVTPGITDGRITEITGDSLKPDTPVIISIKPKPTE
jgi:HlyD family secretion protein